MTRRVFTRSGLHFLGTNNLECLEIRQTSQEIFKQQLCESIRNLKSDDPVKHWKEVTILKRETETLKSLVRKNFAEFSSFSLRANLWAKVLQRRRQNRAAKLMSFSFMWFPGSNVSCLFDTDFPILHEPSRIKTWSLKFLHMTSFQILFTPSSVDAP